MRLAIPGVARTAAALVLVVMLGYLGGHVVRRGVIFVDIALPQVAAFGVAVALFFGAAVGTDAAWFSGLGATCRGASLISATRTGEPRILQEAYIGIIYAVFSAAMILVLTQVPHGSEKIRHVLVGAILRVTWAEVLKTAGLLLVFTLLVVATVMAYRRGRTGGVGQIAHVLGVGLLAVVLGAGASYALDLPTGAASVCVFGLLLGAQVTVEALVAARS